MTTKPREGGGKGLSGRTTKKITFLRLPYVTKDINGKMDYHA